MGADPCSSTACSTPGHGHHKRDTSRQRSSTRRRVTERGEQHGGKFELCKDAKGKFRFRLEAGNGEIIAVGEAYDSKAGAKNGIASVQNNAPDATVVDLTE